VPNSPKHSSLLGGFSKGQMKKRPLTLSRALKRIIDIAGAATLFVLSAPLLAILALWIRRRSPGPALFRQQRAGLHGQPFILLKLRTMHLNAEEILSGHLASSAEARNEWSRYRRLRHDPRLIAGVGAWLRRTSLDELPQLWNVIRGEMSLVGPRPLELPVVAQLPREANAIRHRVRPGITGLWQISGRSEMDIATLARVDAEYMEGWSLWKDIVILCRTPAAVLSGRGAY
jgi:lipopolysaccharide/colanic/teichoic acid biosynthesis glycosyltransferase